MLSAQSNMTPIADDLVRQADDAMHRRRCLLTAAVALRQASSVATARRWITHWQGPPDVKTGALEILGQLEELTP